MTDTKTFKCPACNAPLEYDGVADRLTCEYCGAEIERDAFLDEESSDESGARSWDKYGEGKADWSDSDVTLFTCESCGGEIVCEGTPEEVAKVERSYTGKFLSKVLQNG